MFLLDTSVVSEIRRRDPDPAVIAWFEAADETLLHLSVLVLGEIERGILQVGDRDPTFATALREWLRTLAEQFGDRLISIDARVAAEWGRISAIRTVPAIDGLMAATAAAHEMTLVTRNTADVHGLGVDLLNPFDAS